MSYVKSGNRAAGGSVAYVVPAPTGGVASDGVDSPSEPGSSRDLIIDPTSVAVGTVSSSAATASLTVVVWCWSFHEARYATYSSSHVVAGPVTLYTPLTSGSSGEGLR